MDQIKPGDYDSLTSYIRNRIKNNAQRTQKKYLVILHGPPASGKSHGTRVACRLIYDYFEKTIPVDELRQTFLNTNVDNLTYDIVTTQGISVKQQLLDNLYAIINDLSLNYDDPESINQIRNCSELDSNKSEDVELVLSKIDKLVSTSYEIYQKYRPDNISEIMFYMSAFLGLNIFLETCSGDPAYLSRTIESLKYYGYIPIIIYPFINDLDIIYQRSVKRGMTEGRFIGKDRISSSMKICFDNYSKLIEIISTNDEYGYYQYDSNYEDCETFLKEIYDIGNINIIYKNLLDIGIKNNNTAYDKFTGTNIITMSSIDYSKRIVF